MRIISLLPSATEILCALGLTEELVAVSPECDWPPEVRAKPILDQAIVPSDLPSATLDQTTRQRVHAGLSVYHLDTEQLQALQPDLVLTRERCQACAPTYRDVLRAAKLLDEEVNVVSLEPETLGDILENIRLVGRLTGRRAQAEALIARLDERVARVRGRAGALEDWPRVLCLEWLAPPCVAGGWVPELIEIAGGETFGEPGEPSFAVDWEEIERFNPEVIVLAPHNAEPQRTARELDLLTEHEGWPELRAVKRGRVYLTHGTGYLNRPGPRVVTGLEILAKVLHPEAFRDLALPEGAVYRLETR